jgi:rhodanese-related sulfurtransferase
MSAFVTLAADKLERLIGRPDTPALIDVRDDAAFAAEPRLLPGAVRRPAAAVSEWAGELVGRPAAVVICETGKAVAPGVAAWLRHAGAAAISLDGGVSEWARLGLPMVPAASLPVRDAAGRTVWITRARPKIDRIACPWLIRRFVDPAAVFLFVAPADVVETAARFAATPFDIEGVRWSHDGELCTFDVMLAAFGLATSPLQRLATIVRAADTARLALAPEAPGLLAASLGLSRMYADDLAQLEAGMALYDAFYRWCRDATDETHNWPATTPARKPRAGRPGAVA